MYGVTFADGTHRTRRVTASYPPRMHVNTDCRLCRRCASTVVIIYMYISPSVFRLLEDAAHMNISNCACPCDIVEQTPQCLSQAVGYSPSDAVVKALDRIRPKHRVGVQLLSSECSLTTYTPAPPQA